MQLQYQSSLELQDREMKSKHDHNKRYIKTNGNINLIK